MVTARYLTEKLVEPLRERLREEGRKEILDEVSRKVTAWNNRRKAAEKKGVPFDEPLPVFFFVEQDKAETRQEIYARGYAEGYSSGYSEGRIYGMRHNWYRRKMESEEKGVPFDEPPPFSYPESD